jgi:hypothetical protein
MNPEPSLPDRLKAGSPGLGEAAGTDIERRAIELAMIDGRDAFTDADLARAAVELAGGPVKVPAPEVDVREVAELEEWDRPADQDGRQVSSMAMEDEANISEQLIQEGLEEADHARRVAAAEEVDPDETAD